MITDSVPASPQDTPKLRRSRQSARPLSASPTKRRGRPADVAFQTAVWDICHANHDLSVRQAYYRAVSAHLVPKDTRETGRRGERKVGHAIDVTRERGVDYRLYRTGSGQARLEALERGAERAVRWFRKNLVIPFSWITDSTRKKYQAGVYDDAEAFRRDAWRLYRGNLWRVQPYRVEIWCESESIADVVLDLTYDEGVALLPCRGQSGKRFVFDSAQSYRDSLKPVIVLYVGDFDPAGLDIGESVRKRLARYGAPAIEFHRLTVTPAQVLEMGLIGHGLNTYWTNAGSKGRRTGDRFIAEYDRFGIPREAVESEALPPDVLRRLVSDAVGGLKDAHAWAVEEAVERGEVFDLRTGGLNGQQPM